MNSHHPVVSVVIPTRNRERYLRQAIESVLAQSYPDFEIIVIDDGSTDGTPNLARSFDNPRVRFISQMTAGPSEARNRGMHEATGDYIAFLDDDDLFLPTKLELQVAYLEANAAADLVASGMQLINESGEIQRLWRTWQDQPELTLLGCLYSCPVLPSAVLIRKAVLSQLDQWFDPGLKRCVDKDFFLQVMLQGFRMTWLPEILSAYRIHGASLQRDAIACAQARIILLDKVFANSNLPANVSAEKLRIYGYTHMGSACHSYSAGEFKLAEQDLEQAWGYLAEVMGEDTTRTILNLIAGFARTFHVSDPTTYFNAVFDNLPSKFSWLAQHRDDALSTFYMGNVFKTHRNGGQVSLRDWTKGVLLGPHWLRNRGVWSILMRSALQFPRVERNHLS